ncbi:MAG: PAS domain-containing sensor histidine kinase [Bacteroidota bacterium]
MVTYKLPELFSSDHGQLFALSGNPNLPDYSVYSYIRPAGQEPLAYTFNSSRSTMPFSGFDKPLPELWLDLLGQLLEHAETEDEGIIKTGIPVEYTRECSSNRIDYKFLVSKFPFTSVSGEKYLLSSFRNMTFFLDSIDEIGSRKVLFSLVAENMSDVFCVVDMDARLAFLSASIKKLTGYVAEELAAIPVSSLLTPDSLEAGLKIWNRFKEMEAQQNHSKTEDKPELFEIEFIRKDMVKRWAEVTAATFSGPDGRILGVHGLIRDITERKAKHEAIRSSLKHEIELSNVKSKYISTISHEFRTPLSIIYSNLQLLENHRFQLDAETINDAFELSRMAVKSLLRVLDKVTVIDAVNKGKLEFKPAITDMEKLSRNLVKDLNEMEMVPDRIDLVIHQIPLEVWIDESLFSHIFTNLLLNALNFSEKKFRVKFEISMVSADQACFVISDQGIGIPEDEMNYIFEPFYRTSNARNARGSGLGLAVVRDCLKLHKGEISFESKVGIGSVFKVILPVTREARVME